MTDSTCVIDLVDVVDQTAVRCVRVFVVDHVAVGSSPDSWVWPGLDELAAQLGTNRSELLRRGATAVISAEELATADRELVAGYQRQPPDPALVQSARRLAARTAPAW